MASVLTVRQLNYYLKSVIEGDPRLQSVWVKGEISNLKNHYASGHIYFTLKDNDSAINCVMFRSFAERVKFSLESGMRVILIGRVSLYEKDGQNRFYPEEITPDGVGDIALKFEQTKKKLESEGLFNPETKRRLPKFPKKIAVITSSSGAAVRDIFNVLSRRWPLSEVLMCPVSVQGDLAVPEMLKVLDTLYESGDIDVAIIGRGGGSAEDLWAFNSEELAYKLYEAPFPVISAVGHETDFTICDFVCDLRAPTPSAAAELAVPDKTEMLEYLQAQKTRLFSQLSAKVQGCRLRFEKASGSRVLSDPKRMVEERAEYVDRLEEKLISLVRDKLNGEQVRFSKLSASLDALSPLKTLSRGFAAIKKEGTIVSSVKALVVGDSVSLTLKDGSAECEIKSVEGGSNG